MFLLIDIDLLSEFFVHPSCNRVPTHSQQFASERDCHSQIKEETGEERYQEVETMGFNSSESDEDAAAVETMIIDFDPTEFEGLVTETQETSEGNLSDDSEFEKNNLYDPHVMEEKSTYGSYLQYSYAVKSHKGYFPFEPLKVNQDYTISYEDASTESLIFAVFDGHGEFGHFVSGVHLCSCVYCSVSVMSFYRIWFPTRSGGVM